MKKRLQKYKHNITPRASKARSNIQKLSTDKQKLIASLKARNPYAKNYSPNLVPHSRPRPILPTIDTSKQFMRYDLDHAHQVKPQGFFKKMIKGPSHQKEYHHQEHLLVQNQNQHLVVNQEENEEKIKQEEEENKEKKKKEYARMF